MFLLVVAWLVTCGAKETAHPCLYQKPVWMTESYLSCLHARDRYNWRAAVENNGKVYECVRRGE